MKPTNEATIRILPTVSNCLFIPFAFSIISEFRRYNPPNIIIVPSEAMIIKGIRVSASSTSDCTPLSPI